MIYEIVHYVLADKNVEDKICLQEVYHNCIFFYLTLAFFRANIDFITV